MIGGCTPRGTLGIVEDKGVASLSEGGATEGGALVDGATEGRTTDVACNDLAGAASLHLLEPTNVTDCELIHYPLAFIAGQANVEQGDVAVELGGTVRSWPIVSHRFKALVMLSPGYNHVRFQLDGVAKDLRIVYQPLENPTHLVRLFLYMGSDGTGMLDTPPGVPNSLADAIARLKNDGLMWQTFFAEAFRRSRERQTGQTGLEKKTIVLELGSDAQPVVHLLRHDTMTQADLWNRDDGLADWNDVVRLVNRQTEWDAGQSLHIGFSLVSHVDPATMAYKAGVCLGGGAPEGGGVGMCEGSNLIAHSPTLDEVVARFSDPAPVDNMYNVDDSQDRKTHWAAYATTLGCGFEEGLQGLGVAHAATGIMSSDCGAMNRFFMALEPRPDQTILPISQGIETGHSETEQIDWFHPDTVALFEASPFVQ